MRPTDAPRFETWRALVGWPWLAALAVLVVNDHMLKASVASGWTTGKLSDVAGLFVAPALLATLTLARSRSGVVWRAVAIGAVFGAINLWPEAAAWWDAGMNAVMMPWVTTPDPTDLLALPMLGLGTWYAIARARCGALTCTPGPRIEGTTRARLGWAMASVGALACAASGTPPDFQNDPSFGTVTLFNASHEMHVIEFYTLAPGIDMDCEVVGQDPERMLNNELFESTAPFTVELYSGEEIAVDPTEWSQNFFGFEQNAFNACRAVLVRTRVLPDTVVFWQDDGVIGRDYFHNRDAPKGLDPGDQTIVIDADYSDVAEGDEALKTWREYVCSDDEDPQRRGLEWEECFTINGNAIERDFSDGSRSSPELEAAQQVPAGARYSWRSIYGGVPLHFERPRFSEGMPVQPPARCETPGPGEGLEWDEEIPFGTWEVVRIEEGRDGCHTMQLGFGSGQVSQSFLICAPIDALRELEPQDPETSVELLIQSWEGDGLRFTVVGNASALDYSEWIFVRGSDLSLQFGIDLEEEIRTGCEPQEELCGEVSLPVDMRVSFGSDDLLVEPGQSVEFGTSRKIYLVRAGYRPLLQLDGCEDREQIPTQGRTRVEAVVLVR